jgi:uncharacterized protein (TIGR00369 family)
MKTSVGWGAEQSRLVTWRDPIAAQATTVEIKVNYLKAVTVASGPLTAVGTVVKAGSRIAFTEGKVTDASGNLVATATSTLLIVTLPSGATHSSTNGKPTD